ncbi:alkaline serine exoprotease [Acrasis kona]|uniref:Alkaline serine exoprotease n=1 Tax=Acrasis kona TaxID=1008807 RepID=A0AAW2Z6Z1_9EUKA
MRIVLLFALIATCLCEGKEYIVVLKPGAELSHKFGPENSVVVKRDFDFGPKYRGYIVELGSNSINSDHLLRSAEVLKVETSKSFSLPVVIGKGVVKRDVNLHERSKQFNATYNLDMLDGVVDQTYNYEGDGEGVDAYILDTGILVEHADFEGRARWGADFSPGGRKVDDLGHGTHIAGTIGSKTYGVAKKCNLIAVRIGGATGQPTTAIIISALDFILKSHKSSGRPSIVNMSFGFPYPEMEEPMKILTENGVALVAAAGNTDDDACRTFPAKFPFVLTVAANDEHFKLASFSDFGECVEIIAPGVDIKSTSNRGPKEYETMSGTSMSCPHVVGVLAQAYQRNKFKSVDEAYKFVIEKAKKGAITDKQGRLEPKGKTPNALIQAV